MDNVDYEEGKIYIEDSKYGIMFYSLKHDCWRNGKEMLINQTYGSFYGVGRGVTREEALALADAIKAHFGEVGE